MVCKRHSSDKDIYIYINEVWFISLFCAVMSHFPTQSGKEAEQTNKAYQWISWVSSLWWAANTRNHSTSWIKRKVRNGLRASNVVQCSLFAAYCIFFFNFLCGENGEQRHSFSYAIPDIVCTLIWVPAKMSTSQTFDLKIIILVTNHAF